MALSNSDEIKVGFKRLAIALGRRSLGWVVVECSQAGFAASLLDGGVRVFPDGRDLKTGIPLSEQRHSVRRMRRRRDRYKRRRELVVHELIQLGLLPSCETARKAIQQSDPYAIRATALSEKVPLHSLGRAIFHLSQRRGYRANRLARYEASSDELGVVSEGIARLDDAIASSGARTMGEYLAMRRGLNPDFFAPGCQHVRFRRDSGGDYPFFPARRHVEEEFHALWEAQKRHYPAVLTDEACSRLASILFYQRDLKLPPVGRCAYIPEDRMPKAHPLFQRLKLLRSINELRIEQPNLPVRRLTIGERDRILNVMRGPRATKRTITFEALRKAAQLPEDVRFLGEHSKTSPVLGDEVEAEMVKFLGPQWRAMIAAQQWRIIRELLIQTDDDALLAFLSNELGLCRESAAPITRAKLPRGYARIGETAAARILQELEKDVLTEAEAVARCGLSEPNELSGATHAALPYYGEALERHIRPGTQDPADPPSERFGRISNPTVHIALGQLRRVVNAIIATYGLPQEIVVELTNDLRLSDVQIAEARRKGTRNRDEGIRRGRLLEARGIPNTGTHRAIIRSWEELHPEPAHRVCVFTGTPIDFEMLFSGQTVLEHILPIGSTLDDSNANRLIVTKAASLEKDGRAPFEAFGCRPDWEQIVARTTSLPANKRWRFAPDALSRFARGGGFIDYRLRDRSYLARIIRTYLEVLYPVTGDAKPPVRMLPNTFTEMLRRNWGLNTLLPDAEFAQTAKQRRRLDHRHRVIDAFVAAMTDLPLLQEIASAAGQKCEQGADNIFGKGPEPWPRYRQELTALLDRVIVSHKPDRGSMATAAMRAAGTDKTAGRLHNDTAYGLTGLEDRNGNELVVRRVPLLSLDTTEKVAAVRDQYLRAELQAATKGVTGKAAKDALARFSETNQIFRHIRRVRILGPAKTVKIFDKEGRAYKGYKGNSIHHIDIWRLPNGEWVSHWVDDAGNLLSSAIQMFDAHQTRTDNPEKRPHPAAKKVLRIQQNDLIALDHPLFGECICRVVKLRETGQVTLARHCDAGDLIHRNKDPDDPFKYFSPSASGLKKANARRVRVNEIGRVWDPGPLS